jgi:ubiquinone biosynthesis monooxygenase Coq7
MTAHSPHTRALPGDVLPANQTLARMLRINHAGEYGAKRIYAGQIAVLKNHPLRSELEHMAEQEQVHLDAFNKLLPEHGVRPTALLPIWHVAGFALGAGTALMGARAAMACTVAVETVITDHYNEQLAQPDLIGPELQTTITQFRDEEMEHHDIGLGHDAEQAPFYAVLSGAIKAGCKAAIWIAGRF